jgi:hypothetical protein
MAPQAYAATGLAPQNRRRGTNGSRASRASYATVHASPAEPRLSGSSVPTLRHGYCVPPQETATRNRAADVMSEKLPTQSIPPSRSPAVAGGARTVTRQSTTTRPAAQKGNIR